MTDKGVRKKERSNIHSRKTSKNPIISLSLFLPDLVSINLNYCSMLSYSAFFALFRNCPSLSEVKLKFACTGPEFMASTNNSNSSMDSLVYPQFKSLCLSNNFPLKDENLIYCLRCPKIRHLNLTNCSSLKSLEIDFEVPNLEVLDLTHTRIDDQTLYVISKMCRGLLQLTLQLCTNVTEKGVMHVVKNCTKLREINLDDCSGVHGNVVASMVVLSPSLRNSCST
ncbi:F-box/LRR protein [Medicago truncatula]|uniref:F-box/LRR protein n=1 Tax=Medicago truncatula TaxID=3880 RepID=G7KHH2_MEDTR|nr:F-box/LRR protein [Medicago truncatula]